MNRIAIILNTALMALFGWLSSAAQFKVDNVLMYPNAYKGLGDNFPAITALSLRLRWLCWVVPLLWVAIAVFLVVRMRRTDPIKAPATVQLHTSATLVVGVFMLGCFVLAGVLPFVTFVAGMK